MKRAAALLVIAIFLVVSIYAAAGAVEKMQENNSINLENIENALAKSVPLHDELVALMTKIRFISGVRSFGDIIIGSDGSLLRDMEKPQNALSGCACLGRGREAVSAHGMVFCRPVPVRDSGGGLAG